MFEVRRQNTNLPVQSAFHPETGPQARLENDPSDVVRTAAGARALRIDNGNAFPNAGTKPDGAAGFSGWLPIHGQAGRPESRLRGLTLISGIRFSLDSETEERSRHWSLDGSRPARLNPQTGGRAPPDEWALQRTAIVAGGRPALYYISTRDSFACAGRKPWTPAGKSQESRFIIRYSDLYS